MTEDEIITLCAATRGVTLTGIYRALVEILAERGYVERVCEWRLTDKGYEALQGSEFRDNSTD